MRLEICARVWPPQYNACAWIKCHREYAVEPDLQRSGDQRHYARGHYVVPRMVSNRRVSPKASRISSPRLVIATTFPSLFDLSLPALLTAFMLFLPALLAAFMLFLSV